MTASSGSRVGVPSPRDPMQYGGFVVPVFSGGGVALTAGRAPVGGASGCGRLRRGGWGWALVGLWRLESDRDVGCCLRRGDRLVLTAGQADDPGRFRRIVAARNQRDQVWLRC